MISAAPTSALRRRPRGRAAALGLVCWALLSPSWLFAQDNVATRAHDGVATRAHDGVATRAHDDVATRALRLQFARGLTLESAGRWADALDRFEAVARRRPTANVTFHIGLCHERLGRLRKAERTYQDARAAARTTTPAVLAEIDARLQDLEGRMPKIVLNVAGATEGVTVLLDGEEAPPSRAIRVDPGPHVAVALRHGIPVAASAFSSHERRTRFVTLTVHPVPSRASGP
ncbi:tetratricopeptide repeat protein [Sorangium sp. So ce388]|uniref:tetratricopeptide repeat protein n=1 Tax=Sorangium sp. So ce388 TaxID=3133309 RepID=UPI003F5C62F0